MIKVKDGYGKLIGTTYQGSATQVLLSNGGNLEFSSGTKANTLVQRNANQHVYATYFNSAISDEALTDIGSVYVRNTSDTFIRRISKTQFYSIIDNKFVTLDTAQTITGVKTFSTGPILAINATITQNQNSTSNYTTVVKWLKGGTSQGTYNPSIGQHNTGGDGTGSICILPYPTNTDPWNGTVGLFISKGVLRLDGKAVAIAENYYTKTESDNRYVNVTGDTMTGPLIVKASITGTQLISNIADGTAPLKVTSKTVVTNLNSDLLDGYHETSFFRTRGSQTIASSIPTTTELSSNNNLSGNWNVTFPGASGHLVQFNTGSGSTRYMQFYSHYSGSLYWRNSTDSTLSTKSWKTIVDSANYTGIVLKIGTATKGSATLPIYLNAGTPTACSTTLGVSITGNAATATKLQTARTINGTSFNGTANITTAYWGATRTITLSGAVTGSASINGSQNVTITTTYQTGSIDGRYVGGKKAAGHGSQGTAYTADTYSSNFVNKAFVAYAERGSWAYANNGYITTDTGVNIPLAGTAIFQWGASDTNKTQLFITPHNNLGVSNPATNEMLFYTSNGSGYTPAWTRVLTHRNYTTYTVTKTGSGASGTWGISITGNANTATKLNSRGRLTALSGTNAGETGLSMYEAYSNGYPSAYGNLIHLGGSSAAGRGELLLGWAGSDGGYASVYYRNKRDTSTANWSSWVTLLDSSNYTGILTGYFRYLGENINANWNSITTQGNVRITNQTITNGPTGAYNYGQLLTFNAGGTLSQVYLPHSNTQGMYIRTGWSGTSQYYSWIQMLTSANYYTFLEKYKTASYSTTAMHSSGYYKIAINSYTSWMMYFRIRVYKSYSYFDIDVSGYNYGAQHWYQPKAKLVSSDQASIQVRFGYDSNYHLWVAIPYGNYTGITIYDVVNGHTQAAKEGLFTISYVTSLSGSTQSTITAYRSVSLGGDIMYGTLTTYTTGTDEYNQGIRINRTALNQWATLTIGYVGTGTSGTSSNTWLIGTPANSNSLVFNLNTANAAVGLCLKGHGNTDMKWNNNTVWHAGNDGSGSGLDADLLDGLHSTSFMRFYRQTSVNANNLSTIYPVICETSTGSNLPTSNAWHQIMNWGSGDTAYGFQLVNTYTTDGPLYFRHKISNTWYSWRTLIDSSTLHSNFANGYVMRQYTIDASSLSTSYYYPVTFSIGSSSNVRIECRVSLNSGTKPSWSTHTSGFSVRKIWEVNGSGWGTNPVNRRILVSDYAFVTADPVRGVGQLTNSSVEYVYVRGGGKYYFYTSHNISPVLRTSTYTTNSQSVSPTTSAPAAISTPTLTFTAGRFSALSYKPTTGINTVYIPTNTSHLTNDSGFLTGNVIRAVSANGYWGMARPDSNTSDWIRTTSAGIIPYQSGGRGAGHCGLGTSSWYFSSAYIDTVHGNLDGTATNADKLDGQHASAFSYKSWWHWSGQSGQPSWLWGGNSENNYYVYNPSNFNVNSAAYIRSRGTRAPQTGRTQSLGDVYSYRTSSGSSSTGAPTTYTAVIGFGQGTSGTVEIAGGWTSGMGLWYRALRDTTDNWYGWRKLIDTSNITNYYWANVKVSSSSSTSTSPTFSTAYTSNWFRSNGQTGWYSQTYGGGIYMTDSSYVRVYGSKRFYAASGYLSPYGGGSWISMATRTNCIVADQNNSAESAHALFRVKNSSGHAIAFGGLGANIGFYGFYASRISSGANGTDWSTVWNAGTGVITHSKTIYTAGYYHSSVNSNNYVLLAGGSYKNLADFAKGNAGSSTQGVYVTGGTVKAMTYKLNATVNSGSSGKLAYYSGTNSIDDYTSTKGSSSTPIYLNAGVPTACSGVIVKYWGWYSISCYLSTTPTYSKKGGNFNFVTSVSRRSEGKYTVGTVYPSGYTQNNTIYWGSGRLNKTMSSNSANSLLYVTMFSGYQSGSTYYLYVNTADDSSSNDGMFDVFFLCF